VSRRPQAPVVPSLANLSPSTSPPTEEEARDLSAGQSASQSASQTEPIALLGLDVSQKELVACLLLADGREPTSRFAFANDLPGAQALAERMLRLADQHGFRRLRVGLEATSLYWWHLASFLKSSPLLAPLSPEVYLLNPKLVHGLKKAYSDQGKTDRIDAWFIAERLRIGRLPAPFKVDLVYAPLQRLTRFRSHLAETLAREKNYFLTYLFLSFSAFSQVEPFADPFGVTSSALLDDYTTEQLIEMPLEELASFLNQQGRGHFAEPSELAHTIKRAATNSYQLERALQEPVSLILATTMANIRTLKWQLLEIDKTIAQELQGLPLERRIIDSVPGLGPVYTAGIVSEVGSIQRFENEAALARFAGLVWHPRQSGDFTAEDTSLAKTGNAYLRYYLVEAANNVRLHCPEYRAYYQAKFAQSTKHAHKRALVLTARKLVRLIDALLRAGAAYRPPELRQDQKAVTAPNSTRPSTPKHVRLSRVER
jgi:transposase